MTPRILAACLLTVIPVGCATSRAGSFASPAEALQQLVAAGEDPEVAEELLGSGGFSLLRSGDDVADRADMDAVRSLIAEGVAFEPVGENRVVAHLGKDKWELPIPLVLKAGRWRFDVEAGREEILNRRVGRNELSTIASLHELVAAQREYAAEGRDGNPPAYARLFLSSEGQHDGLYWPVAEGEQPSPLGPLLAAAEDLTAQSEETGPSPFQGYFYRVLTAQGSAAPGGERSYLDDQGRLADGFAFLAWPATYGNSGVMTFLISEHDIVFERDLGEDTDSRAAEIDDYDPTLEWTPTAG